MKFVKYIAFITLSLIFSYQTNADELKKLPSEHEYNFYSGMFDFSDSGKKSTLFGFQHEN